MQNTIDIASTARVWIYMADRELTPNESEFALTEAQKFVSQWAAHGAKLAATADVKHNRFIVLMVDESQAGASGCSIDSSVHFIKALGSHLKVDFFNRLLMAYQKEDGSIATIPQAKLETLYKDGTITENTLVFNNLVQNKAAFDQEWQVPLKDSFYMRLV